MRAFLPDPSRIVIDSNLAVWTVLPVFARLDVVGRLAEWQRDGAELFAPSLWVAESVSAIRGGVYTRAILPEEGRAAIDDLFALEVETFPMSLPLSQSAFRWAGLLGQGKAYDAFYLAVAEELGAVFWTADQRLANGARQAGAAWAHWIGETAGQP